MSGAQKKRVLEIFGFALVVSSYLAFGLYYMEYGKPTASEHCQGLLARETIAGRMPLRDFAVPDMVLSPYLAGALMKGTGFGLIPLRAINLTLSGLGLLVILYAMRRRLGCWEPGLAAVFAAAVSPHWIAIQTVETSHASASLFLAIAALAAAVPLPFSKRLPLFSIAAALAIGCHRLALPVAAVLGVVLLVETEGRKRRLLAALVMLGAPVILLLPFIILGGKSLFYFNWIFPSLSTVNRTNIVQLAEWWRVSPGMILAFVTGLLGLPGLLKARLFSEAILLASGMAAIVLPMLSIDSYGYFISAGAPVAAASGIIAFRRGMEGSNNLFAYAFWVFPLIALVYPLPERAGSPPQNRPDAAPLIVARADAEIRGMASAIRKHAPKGRILTPVPSIAVAARRRVIDGTELGMYSVLPPQSYALARRLNMTTIPVLVKKIRNRIPAAIVAVKTPLKWNFKWQMPSFRNQPRDFYEQLGMAVQLGYKSVYQSENMELFIPK